MRWRGSWVSSRALSDSLKRHSASADLTASNNVAGFVVAPQHCVTWPVNVCCLCRQHRECDQICGSTRFDFFLYNCEKTAQYSVRPLPSVSPRIGGHRHYNTCTLKSGRCTLIKPIRDCDRLKYVTGLREHTFPSTKSEA